NHTTQGTAPAPAPARPAPRRLSRVGSSQQTARTRFHPLEGTPKSSPAPTGPHRPHRRPAPTPATGPPSVTATCVNDRQLAYAVTPFTRAGGSGLHRAGSRLLVLTPFATFPSPLTVTA